jgi:hypothetical protein
VLEHHLAQVVLHTLSQHAGQVDERKNEDSLQEDERAVNCGYRHQGSWITRNDRSVHDLQVKIGEVGIGYRSERDHDQESNNPLFVRSKQRKYPLQDWRGKLAGIFFFFDFNQFF